MGVDQYHRVGDREEFQLAGVPIKPGGSADLSKTENGSSASMEVKVDVRKSETSFMKRKRGRPPKGQIRITRTMRKKEEEDVCFICFDGGSLVLCDRRGCPKAYHPSCIKRDETFFRSRAKWTCGWHICSKCQKAAHYMCYTCTYSLCKGCTKDVDYVRVRGNFGFCGICMRTIMLIENITLGNKDKCEVDFDDKSSWEYLFKVYWVYLKNKLSLTLDELNGGESTWKADLMIGSTDETSSRLFNHGREEKCSFRGSSCVDIETNDSKRRETIDHRNSVIKEESTCMEELGIDKKMPLPESANWESKELLETKYSKERKTTDHQISVTKDDSVYNENFGIDKKMPLPESTNWESKELWETNYPKRRKTTDQPSSISKEDSTHIEKLDDDRKMPLEESRNWASKELLELVGHVKNGDTSVLSQYDVQALLLEYVERKNLRDPCQKCEILCDVRLKNLFGQARVSQIEVPELLKSHILIEEKTPGEINLSVRSLDTVVGQGEINGCYDSQVMIDIDKRHKHCEKIGIQGPPNALNAYEEIDTHTLKLIYLRRKQMEDLVEDADTFHQKIVGSIVRIKIPNRDPKTDKYRLVLVVGTREVSQQYKIGVRTTDVMLEIINVHKKEVISIDGISNQEFSEDECRRFRRSIKTGLSKFLNACGSQEKAMILQAMRVNNGAQTLQLNHLYDRPNEKSYDKEPREFVKKLLFLKSKDEQQRLHELPAVQSDHKMDRSYEFDDDDDAGELKEKMTDDNFRSQSSGPNGEERESLSPGRRDYDLNVVGTGVNETSAVSYDQVGRESSLETGVILTAQGTRNSGYAVETLKLSSSLVASETLPMRILNEEERSMNAFEADDVWHYKDHPGKTRGPFSLFQLHKGNAGRHFSPDLRIWRTDGKPDRSVLLTEALNDKYQKNMSSVTVSVGGDDGCNSDRISDIDKRSITGSKGSKLEIRRPHHKCNDESARINEWNCHSSIQAAMAKCDAFFHCKIPDCQSVPSTTLIERRPETTSGHRMEGSQMNDNSDVNDSDWDLIKTRQSHSEQVFQQHLDIDGHSGLSSEHNTRPLPVSSFSTCLDFSDFPTKTPVSSSSDCWGSKCTFASISKKLQLNEEIDFFELPSPDPTPNNVSKSQACQNKPSPSSWSTASSLVSDPVSHPEAVECREYSPMPTQPSVEEWDSSFVQTTEIATDHDVTPSSISCQHPQSSPSKLANTESNWQVIIDDSNDLSFDESVSDLLAEVEAMESRGGVHSPTSIMNYGGQLTDASKNDCLSSAEGLGSILDIGKVDVLNSTVDAEPHGRYQADMFLYERMTGTQCGIGTNKTDSFVHQKEASANIPVSVPSTTTWEVTSMDIPWRSGSDFSSTLWGAAQGNGNLSWSPLEEGNSNMNWGNPGMWETKTRNGGDRISTSKDQNFHGRDYSSDRGRTRWNRQPISDMVNATASQRHGPKGQAICKYYEAGLCNKGGSCSHWHP